MPCTYCSNPKHTRKECEEIDNDFQTYLNVSIGVREDYVRELTRKGIVPGAVVRTYNRTKDFTNKSSEVAVAGLGNVDMFDCYIKVGRNISTVRIPTKEHIILDDNDDRMVTPNHCYEITQESEDDWTATWVTTPVLTEDEFKAMFKGKKRHIGFEKTLYNCAVTRYTNGAESIEEMVARLKREAEEEKRKMSNVINGESIYVVTATSTSDDYKRVHSSSETKTATSFETAQALAAQMYLEQAEDWDTFYFHKDLLQELSNAVSDTNDVAATTYEFFEQHEGTLFEGEFVPTTFHITIEEQQTEVADTSTIRETVQDLVERFIED
jgi:hypothetical protein